MCFVFIDINYSTRHWNQYLLLNLLFEVLSREGEKICVKKGIL